ncbi:hypothetical protein KB336_004764 [Escherichia coli]|nr:hypothetical protein [Escherichia coli]EET6326345.1 hypothetical protein [Escherichia coli]EEV3188032.1 hypothetical protein [Escherichia coli]EFI4507251.1 hypothetical protein [Escherichia coli]EFJ3597115.1 hypothetical protein [Escherichia coli]
MLTTSESQFRQKDQQLSLVEETEAFLCSALARAEEKIEEDEREIGKRQRSTVLTLIY